MPDLPRLELKHLAMLVAIGETGTVGRAADRLGLTPSAVTHRIREAERRLDLQLFHRAGKRLAMTAAGEQLHGLAGRLLRELVHAERDLAARFGGALQVVRVGQGIYSRFHWLPGFLRFLEASEPDLELDLVAGAAQRPLAALREGAVDVAVVYGHRRAQSDFAWRHLGADPLVVVMAPDHPLAARRFVAAEDLVGERYITYSTTPEPGFEWETVLRPAGIGPRRVSVVQLPEAIIDLVRAGFGVSTLSRWAVGPELDDGTLVARPLTREGLSLDWWAVVRAGESEPAPAGRLARAMVRWSHRAEGGLASLGFGS